MTTRNRRNRPGGMQIGPNPIDFGVSPPQSSTNAQFSITYAQSDALLSASIMDDDSRGHFRILSLTSYDEEREPVSSIGEIPRGRTPGGHSEETGVNISLVPTDSTDGARPLTVSSGQIVEILLRFYSLEPAAQDRFTATLVIQDVSPNHPWEPIRVPMIAQVAGITSILPDAIQLTRGQRMRVPITVVSDAAPDTIVSYTLESRQDGISMTPLQVPLPRGGRVTATLEFGAAADAPLGARHVTLYSSAFDGKLISPLDLPVRVLAPQEEICQSLETLSAPWAQGDQVWSNYGITDSTQTFLGYLPTPKLFRPTNPYEVSIAIREAESANKTIRALGSGWSFSDDVLPQSDALSDAEQLLAWPFEAGAKQGKIDEPSLRGLAGFFSSHFGYAIDTTTLDRTLQTLLPNILADNQNTKDLFFVEAGMTIYDLNILLDSQPEKERLALKTMGGASAQTIAGAISTGTHGGDFDRPPLADSVRAIYLIGAGGVHHWIEPSNSITERGKIQATFPCIADQHIYYDDDMFRAALVSMGAMGVIYAVILDVVPQYSLLEFNRWSTWERLNAETAPDFAGLFSGDWSGLTKYLKEQFPAQPSNPNRFVQVVINPIRNKDGKHNCYVTNRVQLDLMAPRGVTPLGYGEVLAHFDWVVNAIKNSPDGGFSDEVQIAIANAHNEFEPKNDSFALARTLLAYCKDKNFPWVIRAIIDLIMQKSFPSSGEWTAVWDPMGGQWPGKPVVAPNPSGGLSVFLIGEGLHNLFRYDQDGASGQWSNAISMGGDWSQDHPVVIGGTPYVGMSVFLIAKDERGLGRVLFGGLVSALTAALIGGLAEALGGFALGADLGARLADVVTGGPYLCRYDLSSPQIDVGYKVMAPASTRPTRLPTLAGTSIEAAFSFFPTVPSTDQPGLRVRVPDVITFVNSILAKFDEHVDSDAKVFPAGWLSLRVTGHTDALLGMQQFDPSGMFEVALIGNSDDYRVVQEVEKIALDQGGALHWGQSNGLMDFLGLEAVYGNSRIDKWKDVQRKLGGDTFTNVFMRRCGLV